MRRRPSPGAQVFGKIDTLVSNAGDGGPTKPVQEYSMEDWRYTIDSVSPAPVCTRFVVPEMIKAGGGAIMGSPRRGAPRLPTGSATARPRPARSA
jgi:NADP-dependent 3-hydroxy acid dehydrogenase YdfG